MNCFLCEAEMNSFNTPMFGGTTINGEKACTKCVRKIAWNKPELKFKKLTATEIIEALREDNDKVEELNGVSGEKAKELSPLDMLKDKVHAINPRVAKKREVKDLLDVLMENEEIMKAETGVVKLNDTDDSGVGIIICTNLRVIFLHRPPLSFGVKMEDFPYKNITSVRVDTGILKGKITVICSGNSVRINLMDGKTSKDFSEFIRKNTHGGGSDQREEHGNNMDFMEKLEKLDELRSRGILTQEEFDAQKSKLLGL